MITLLRTHMTDTETVGVLCHNGIPLCFTLEVPWRDNHQNESCIPPGMYSLTRFVSEQHGVTLQVEDVPHRTGILFHCGNRCTDTKGCILVGQEFAKLPPTHGVVLYDSRKAFDLYISELIQNAPHLLKIINPKE